MRWQLSQQELDGIAPAQTMQPLMGEVLISMPALVHRWRCISKTESVTSIFGNTQPLYVVDGVFMDNSATSGGLNAVTAASAGGNSSNQDNPSNRIADLRAEILPT
jgi:hypothetical protein